MTDYPSVNGYRVLSVRKPDRQLSYDYLALKPTAAHAHGALREAVKHKGANCVGREEFFSGEELPSDRDGALACATCPSFTECEIFRKIAHPAWGVFAGVVVGRNLDEVMGDE